MAAGEEVAPVIFSLFSFSFEPEHTHRRVWCPVVPMMGLIIKDLILFLLFSLLLEETLVRT